MASIGLMLAVAACTTVAAQSLAGPEVEAAKTAASEADEDQLLSAVVETPPQRRASDSTGSTVIDGQPGTDPDDGSTIVAHVTTPTIEARLEPDERSDLVASFQHPTAIGGPLVLQALGPPVGGWIEVLLPMRPNGTRGWVPVDQVELTRNPYRIEIDLAAYEITVLRGQEIQVEAPIAVGTGDTPTPIGDFYLVELLKTPNPDGPYGPYAYGLSAYSDVLDNFNGGDGVIGIHGTNQPGLLGGPASHGCIRLHNDVIEHLATFLPLGTPVSISPAT